MQGSANMEVFAVPLIGSPSQFSDGGIDFSWLD